MFCVNVGLKINSLSYTDLTNYNSPIECSKTKNVGGLIHVSLHSKRTMPSANACVHGWLHLTMTRLYWKNKNPNNINSFFFFFFLLKKKINSCHPSWLLQIFLHQRMLHFSLSLSLYLYIVQPHLQLQILLLLI